jgi:hypothetical protein
VGVAVASCGIGASEGRTTRAKGASRAARLRLRRRPIPVLDRPRCSRRSSSAPSCWMPAAAYGACCPPRSLPPRALARAAGGSSTRRSGAAASRPAPSSVAGGWGTRIPVAYTQGVACLDHAARRVAVVLGGGRVKSLRDVSRGADRTVRRFRGEVPLVTPTRVYVTDRRGVRAYALPSGRIATRLDAPADAHIVSPTPDGRHLAIGARSPGRMGRVPRGTWLIAPLL